MRANHIKINISRLDSDSKQIEGLIKSMENELNNMESSVNRLNKMWEGKSKEMFTSCFHQEMETAREVMKVLRDIQKFERTAKKRYENCERKAIELVNSIRI